MTIRTTHIKQEIIPVEHSLVRGLFVFVPATRIATIVERIPATTMNITTHKKLTVDDYRVAVVRFSGGIYMDFGAKFGIFEVYARMMQTAHEQLIKHIEL